MATQLQINNLPEGITTKDIHAFLDDLGVSIDGIRIFGGENVVAFVKFMTDGDLLRALSRDGDRFLGKRLNLLLATADDVDMVISKLNLNSQSGDSTGQKDASRPPIFERVLARDHDPNTPAIFDRVNTRLRESEVLSVKDRAKTQQQLGPAAFERPQHKEKMPAIFERLNKPKKAAVVRPNTSGPLPPWIAKRFKIDPTCDDNVKVCDMDWEKLSDNSDEDEPKKVMGIQAGARSINKMGNVQSPRMLGNKRTLGDVDKSVKAHNIRSLGKESYVSKDDVTVASHLGKRDGPQRQPQERSGNLSSGPISGKESRKFKSYSDKRMQPVPHPNTKAQPVSHTSRQSDQQSVPHPPKSRASVRSQGPQSQSVLHPQQSGAGFQSKEPHPTSHSGPGILGYTAASGSQAIKPPKPPIDNGFYATICDLDTTICEPDIVKLLGQKKVKISSLILKANHTLNKLSVHIHVKSVKDKHKFLSLDGCMLKDQHMQVMPSTKSMFESLLPQSNTPLDSNPPPPSISGPGFGPQGPHFNSPTNPQGPQPVVHSSQSGPGFWQHGPQGPLGAPAPSADQGFLPQGPQNPQQSQFGHGFQQQGTHDPQFGHGFQPPRLQGPQPVPHPSQSGPGFQPQGPHGPQSGPGFQPQGPHGPQSGPGFQPHGPQSGPGFQPHGPQTGPGFQPQGPHDPQSGPGFRPQGPHGPQSRPDFQPHGPQSGPGFRPQGPHGPQSGPDFQPQRPHGPQSGPGFRPQGPHGPQSGPDFQPHGPQSGPGFRPQGPHGPQSGPGFRPQGPHGPQSGPDFQPQGPPSGPGFRPQGPHGPQSGPDFRPHGPQSSSGFRPQGPQQSQSNAGFRPEGPHGSQPVTNQSQSGSGFRQQNPHPNSHAGPGHGQQFGPNSHSGPQFRSPRPQGPWPNTRQSGPRNQANAQQHREPYSKSSTASRAHSTSHRGPQSGMNPNLASNQRYRPNTEPNQRSGQHKNNDNKQPNQRFGQHKNNDNKQPRQRYGHQGRNDNSQPGQRYGHEAYGQEQDYNAQSGPGYRNQGQPDNMHPRYGKQVQDGTSKSRPDYGAQHQDNSQSDQAHGKQHDNWQSDQGYGEEPYDNSQSDQGYEDHGYYNY